MPTTWEIRKLLSSMRHAGEKHVARIYMMRYIVYARDVTVEAGGGGHAYMGGGACRQQRWHAAAPEATSER